MNADRLNENRLVCVNCERGYEDWVTADDDVWGRVVPEDGLWCPDCFIARGFAEHGMDQWQIVVGQEVVERLAALDAAEQRVADAEKGRQIANEGWDAAEQRAEDWKAAFGVKPLADPETARLYVQELAKQAVLAEQERDEWQELAIRLAEEAGVDAEAMLAQARAENKP